ncbi:hypothetical protein [Phormidium sp. FACHB-1136]|uniref:hypothetical protein n=1 Tax=Phormidium sp. FACHB-1136 TaxID=2692848 RepID=UPI00168A1770|nr:hypothetical protein [Phormidium sp. FACHB-1136]MBD2426790.1 hypothetical protein [Phormidium sp. FACHB-1136]
MKFTPSASNYDLEDVENAMRVERIAGGSEFSDLQKYLDSCSLHNESEYICNFLKESHVILRVMSDTSGIFYPPFPETAVSTAILGPIMRLLRFYSNGLTVLHEVPLNFKLTGDSWHRTLEGRKVYEDKVKHEVEGRIDFLVLSSKPERKTEDIEIANFHDLHYLSRQTWKLGIEVKKCGDNDLFRHVDQLLLYMNTNINLEIPKYGLLTNGKFNILISLSRSQSLKKYYSLFSAEGVDSLFYILKFFRLHDKLKNLE